MEMAEAINDPDFSPALYALEREERFISLGVPRSHREIDHRDADIADVDEFPVPFRGSPTC